MGIADEPLVAKYTLLWYPFRGKARYMSLGVIVKGPEGIVLAADSRVTLEAMGPGMKQPIHVNFDNATKLLNFGKKHAFVGAVTYGVAVVGLRTAHSYMSEFELELGDERLTVEQYAQKIGDFFLSRWKDAGMPEAKPGPSMTFIVGGYDHGQPYGSIFLVEIPHRPQPAPRNPGPQDFGMTWGGQLDVASRLIHGTDPALLPLLKDRLKLSDEQLKDLSQLLAQQLQYRIPFDILPLQDSIDLATFLIRATITMQNLGVTVRGVGGTIEIATVTRTSGLVYVQKKRVHGEYADSTVCNAVSGETHHDSNG